MYQNRGLILKGRSVLDFLHGAVKKEVLNPSRQWTDELVKTEYQKSYNTNFDTFGCVTFSALNCIEILYKRKFGVEINYSDRFTAVMSNTIPGRGNFLRAVAESIRKDGLVLESDYPFVDNEKEYYQEVPNELKKKAKTPALKLQIHWEWLHFNGWQNERDEVLKDGLQYGPIQVSVPAWPKPVNGVYPRVFKVANHAVTLVGYKEKEYWIIFDHYANEIKHLAWNYLIGTPLLFTIGGSVNLAKKYQGQLFKNQSSPKVYYSDGKQIAWIKNEESFYFGHNAGFWGYWDSIIDVSEEINENLTF